ncbi:hypothetical protein DFH09DRAFT_1361730 [Mycena vulgaris]|nr:hypothetical protein DFH09DRAFT_1361730 [Mycena vulgaris]
MIPDLCVELLQAIGLQTSTEDQKSLRAVSRRLRVTIEPLFFAATPIILDVAQRRNSCIAQLTALGAGQTAWSPFARRLVIRSLFPVEDFKTAHQEQVRMRQLLRVALESLKQLDSIQQDGDADWATAIVTHILSTSAQLKDVHLVDRVMNRERFPALSGMSDLRSLRVEAATTGTDSDWMCQVVSKSPRLECVGVPAPSDSPKLFDILQQKNIYLTRMFTARVSQALVKYLASYSGLEELMIHRTSGDDLAADFFARVLPRHKATLSVLSIPGSGAGKWSLGAHNIAALSELRRLQSLEMSVDFFERLPSVKNIVETFLEVAVAQIPALRELFLRGVLRAHTSGCGNAISRQRAFGQRQIDESVAAFGKMHAGSAAVARLVKSHARISLSSGAQRYF